MVFSVGEPALIFANTPEAVHFICDDSGLGLIYNFNNPTEHEIEQVQTNKPFEIKFTTINNVMFIMTKCGDLPWTDSTCNPALCRVMSLQEPIEENIGYSLLFILIDAKTNIVKNIRTIGLGHEFSINFMKEFNRILNDDSVLRTYNSVSDFAQANSITINKIFNKYSTEDLVAKSKQKNSYKI